MAVKFSNNAATVLAANASSSTTSLTVSDGSVFPTLSGSDYTYVTLEDLSENREVVKVTAISGNTLTVVRGQDGTSARAFSTADKCELRITAALLNDLNTEADTESVSIDGDTMTGGLTVPSLSVTGNTTTSGTIDGRDVSVDGAKLDGIEAGATADQTNAEIRAAVEAATDSNVFTDADHSKLNAIEASADVTDATNVTAAGALMDSEVTNLADVKAFDSSDYATATQGNKADAALPLAGGAMTGAITTNSTFDGRDVSVDGTKLDGIETGATADQSNAEIRAAVEAASDSNVFTNADHSKLDGISAGATANAGDITGVTAGTGLTGGGSSGSVTLNVIGGDGITANADNIVVDSTVARNTANYLFTQRIRFNANQENNWDTIATGTGSQGSLEVYNAGSGNDAFMAFHAGGDYAGYFGLDADTNDLAWGGWSVGAVKHRIWHAGNDGSTSGLDADLLDGVDSPVFFKSPSNVSGWQNSNANFSVRTGNASNVGLHMEQSNGNFGFQLYSASGTYGFLDSEWGSWDIQKVANGTFKVDEGLGLKHVLNEANWSSYISVGNGTLTINTSGSASGGGSFTANQSGNATITITGATIPTSLPANGGNADTVDGLHAVSFIRSDAADTASGAISFTGGHGAINITSSSIVSSASSTWTGDPGGAGKIQYHSNRWYIVSDSSSNRIVQFRRNGTDKSWIDNDGKFQGTATNADALGSYSPSSSGDANTIVLRTSSGHIYGQYIFSTYLNAASGNSENPSIGQVWTQNTSDNYLRKSTPAHFKSQLGLWHTGNDGSGSGLDADNIRGRAFVNTGSGGGQNADTINSNGISYYTSGVTNFSGNATDGALYSQQYSSSWQHQIAGDYRSGQIALRGKNNGTWQSWRKVWDASNDGSGSGLDADLLDGQDGSYYAPASSIPSVGNGTLTINTAGSASGSGTFTANQSGNATITITGATIPTSLPANGGNADTVDNLHAASFIRSDANDSFSGALTSTARNNGIFGTYDSYKTDHIWSMGTNYTNHSAGTNFGNIYGLAYKHTNNSTGGNMGGGHQMVWALNGNPYGAIGESYVWHTSGMRVGSSNVWHAGNDGSGSGLDADLLDGQEGSYYATGSHGHTGLGVSSWGGIKSSTSSGYIEFGPANTSHAHIYTDRPNFYFNKELLVNGNTVWNAGNDGSGSGLDADTLDGLNLSASTTNNGANLVMRTDANGYANFGWIYTASGTASSSLSRIYCSQDGYLRYLSPSSLGTSWLKEDTYNNLSVSTGHGANLNTVFNNNKSGNIDVFSGSNYPPGTTHVQGIQVRHSTTNHYGFQLVNQYSQSKFFARSITNNSFGSWQQIWSAHTDGSGSGLDADTLDGSHASSFITTSATQSNQIYIRGTGPTLYLRDTDHKVSMLHTNGNVFYVLCGATDSTTWNLVNGRWPMELNLSTLNVTFGGSVTANSDRSLKENIKPIGNSMEMFEQIDAKRFDWIDGHNPDGDLGFIAQDVQAAGLTEVVFEKENKVPGTGELLSTKLTLDYSRMVAVLWDVVKQQQVQIDELKTQLENM